jgi:hypothetical protein
MTNSTTLPQGDLGLLDTPAAQELLQSQIPARLAYLGTDGTPRVIPTWFHWTGTEVVMATYLAGPRAGIRQPASRVAALRAHPAVALIVDTDTFPPKSLTIRGSAEVTVVDGLAPEYVAAAHRYLGAGAGAMIAEMDQEGTTQARIAVRPSWVGLIDFVTRLPAVQGGVQG